MTAIVARETSALTLAAQAIQLRDFGGMLVSSGMLPSSIRTPEAAVTIIVKGMELGLPPMAALNGITVIQGKPTVSPQLMLSLINRSGQLENIEIETGKDGATVTMKRRGRTPFTAKFGPTEAQAMGLNTKDNYKKQPAVMYQWRAVAACARVVFPDVIDGMYTPEELGADVQVDEDGAMTVTVQQEVKAQPGGDVTRQVQEAAGTPAHTLRDPELDGKLQKWAVAIGDMAARVRKVAPAQDVQGVLNLYDWRTDLGAANAVYEDLKALGTKHAPKKAAPAQQEVQDAVFTPDPAPATSGMPAKASAEQIGQLQAAAKGMGADTSEKRAALWGWMLQHDAPIPTATLNGDEAEHALKYLGKNNPEQRAQCLVEALTKFPLPAHDEALFDASGAPF
ncbi:hypothetical protein [Deinococcus yunweiensis]|uniref:hypothetical protein n=1 Tax=Deinococcus yunweiensis TaxID=367282 RepID=UPI00398E77D7